MGSRLEQNGQRRVPCTVSLPGPIENNLFVLYQYVAVVQSLFEHSSGDSPHLCSSRHGEYGWGGNGRSGCSTPQGWPHARAVTLDVRKACKQWPGSASPPSHGESGWGGMFRDSYTSVLLGPVETDVVMLCQDTAMLWPLSHALVVIPRPSSPP